MNQDLLTVTHLGENPDKYMNAVVPPVFMNSLHVFDTYEKQSTVNLKEDFVYGRTANPTTTILEKKIAALEHGKKAVAFSVVWEPQPPLSFRSQRQGIISSA